MKSSRYLPVLTLAAVLATSMSAEAKQEFPGEIARHLGAPSDPPCGVCHQDAKTGKDTLVTPFAWAMRARGMTSQDTLLGALDRLRSDAVDSDGDGATDVDELIAGSDPNSAASTPAMPGTVRDPQLGCTMAGRAREGGAGTLSFAAFVTVCLVRRRRASRG
jgi:Bacterial TSP3 repeat